MQFLILIFIIFVTNATLYADTPSIVAFVNNEPITLYEFNARKKMLIALNNVDHLNSDTNKQINKAVLNSLIDEQLLFQQAKKVGSKITDNQIEEAIASIAERNKISKNDLLKYLSDKNVNMETFRAQLKAELLKSELLYHIVKSVNVTATEIDNTILSYNKKDAKVLAYVFTSNDKDSSTLQKMYNLKTRLKHCDNVNESLYKKFATARPVNDNLNNLDKLLQIVIRDLRINSTSTVFETDRGFELVLLCKKTINDITSTENEYVTNALTNKKMSQKAQKFFEDLRKKSYIKVMLPSDIQ